MTVQLSKTDVLLTKPKKAGVYWFFDISIKDFVICEVRIRENKSYLHFMDKEYTASFAQGCYFIEEKLKKPFIDYDKSIMFG